MSEKIGIFLMTILVLWSVLLLDATKNRKPIQPAAPPTESTEVLTEPSLPETMPPETTASAVLPTQSPVLARTEDALAKHTMNRTAATHLVRTGTAGDSQTAALAELAAGREMNPIAAFWMLESEGLYEREADQPGLPSVSLPEMPAQAAKQYPYTDAGAEQLLSDLLTLAGGMEKTMSQALLGEDGAVEPGQVTLSGQDGCRYAYFAQITDRSVRILCFYLRSDARGKWITDVEYQLLHMSCSADPEQGGEQAAALAAAAELLMTGSSRAGREETGDSYEVGGFSAAAERFFFTAEKEQGSLTNYRLRK